MGDARRYEYVISLRAVETTDFMTVRRAYLPCDFPERISGRIINESAWTRLLRFAVESAL